MHRDKVTGKIVYDYYEKAHYFTNRNGSFIPLDSFHKFVPAGRVPNFFSAFFRRYRVPDVPYRILTIPCEDGTVVFILTDMTVHPELSTVHPESKD